jgi:hypothetical protein
MIIFVSEVLKRYLKLCISLLDYLIVIGNPRYCLVTRNLERNHTSLLYSIPFYYRWKNRYNTVLCGLLHVQYVHETIGSCL